MEMEGEGVSKLYRCSTGTHEKHKKREMSPAMNNLHMYMHLSPFRGNGTSPVSSALFFFAVSQFLSDFQNKSL
jgi:hypothetical protein